MLCFGIQNINRAFFLISKPLNMLDGILFVFCLLLNMLFLLFLAVLLLIASAAPILLHFNLEKHHFYFDFSFQATVDLPCCLFLDF